MNRLVARIKLSNGVSFSIREDSLPLKIGRGVDCELRIPAKHISRQHCELYLEGQKLFLRDTSTNGTMVGQEKLRNESIPLQGSTDVLFANEMMITVTPCAISDSESNGSASDGKPDEERRLGERRRLERRSNVVTVDFDRRGTVARRTLARRVDSQQVSVLV